MTIYLIISHIIVAIIAFIICCFWQKRKPKTCIENGDYNSSALISDAATQTLVDNFQNSLNKAFNPITCPPETPPVKFHEASLAYVSFADLKKYMCFIESLSIKNGFSNISNLGIRMYYGRYPCSKAELAVYKENNTIDDTVVGHHTLVMVPTFADGKRNVDFNPHYIGKEGPMTIDAIKSMNARKTSNNQPPPLAANKGSILPETASNANTSTTITIDTNVNLNSFGLTPPTPGSGTGFIKP
jgi:hypothetical protein